MSVQFLIKRIHRLSSCGAACVEFDGGPSGSRYAWCEYDMAVVAGDGFEFDPFEPQYCIDHPHAFATLASACSVEDDVQFADGPSWVEGFGWV